MVLAYISGELIGIADVIFTGITVIKINDVVQCIKNWEESEATN